MSVLRQHVDIETIGIAEQAKPAAPVALLKVVVTLPLCTGREKFSWTADILVQLVRRGITHSAYKYLD